MMTEKQVSVSKMAKRLTYLGLLGSDTDRLAKRVQAGQGSLSQEVYADILCKACKETIDSKGDFLIRFVEKELVVYGPKGYASIDSSLGEVNLCKVYGTGYNFESMTALVA